MAHSVRVRRSRLIWVLPLLMIGACTTYSGGTFERPVFTRDGLLALSSEYYLVRASPGDTYMGLAWEHNVSPYAVISLNDVKAPYRLRPGDLVRIPTPRIHVVRRGETLSGIADTYHVDFYDLAQANALNSPFTIYPGQVLGLPATGPVFRPPRGRPRHASLPPLKAKASRADPAKPRPRPAGPKEEELAALPLPRPRPPEALAAETRQVAALPRPKPRPPETLEAATEQVAALPRPKPRALAVPSESGSEAAESTDELIWPVRGRIIAGFGPTPNGRRNDGINIAVPEGTPVRAAADGVVIYCGNEVGGFGNLVLIRHADDLVTAYAHASEFKVAKGDRVRKGQSIALSGSTGNVEEPQLHFEVRRGVEAVDPVEHLSA